MIVVTMIFRVSRIGVELDLYPPGGDWKFVDDGMIEYQE
jgi:hypothetical protein